jgi:hypothetical protein
MARSRRVGLSVSRTAAPSPITLIGPRHAWFGRGSVSFSSQPDGGEVNETAQYK